MILIFSSNNTSENIIINWIISSNKKYIRINPTDCNLSLKRILINEEKSEIIISINSEEVNLNCVEAIYIWHGSLIFNNNIPVINKNIKNEQFDAIIKDIHGYHSTLIHYVFSYLYTNTPLIIGDYHNQNLNKLIVLEKARNVGLIIPDTEIISDKPTLIKLIANNKYITKPVKEISKFKDKKNLYVNYTKEINHKSINSVDEFFMPSLIQRKIDKKYEIRVFYLMGNMYSMAIMSQNKNETEIDFRNYQNQNPNRTLSYELPDEINKKIIKLMDVLKLNSGSIDFIYNTNNEYVFLEVNPVGQYGMVSYPCNYYIEKKIANYLTNE